MNKKLYEFYESATENEKKFIKSLAYYYGQSLSWYSLEDAAKKQKITYSKLTKLKKQLTSLNFIEGQFHSWSFEKAYITEQGCLFAIIMQAKEEKQSKDLFNVPKEAPISNISSYVKDVLNKITNYLLTGELPVFSNEDFFDKDCSQLLYTTLDFAELTGMQHSIPMPLIYNKFTELANNSLTHLLPPGPLEEFYRHNINHPEIEDSDRRYFENIMVLLNLYQGKDIATIADTVSTDSALGNYIKALSYHLRGEVRTAIVHYEQGMGFFIESKAFMPGFKLFDYSYSLALVQDDSPESQKKIASLIKKKDLKKADYVIPYYIFTAPTETNSDKLRTHLEKHAPELTMVTSCLLSAIGRYFGQPAFGLETEDILHTSYKLLALELASSSADWEQTYRSLQKQIGFPSLISQTHRVEEWEKVIKAITQSGTTTTVADATNLNLGRIIYLLSPEHMYLSMALQKSKDGIHWTKGRSVSLERFSKGGIPEMNETDKLVALHVKRVSSAYYYNSVSYQLDIPAALAELIGYPWVFLASNNDIPVEVVKGIPEMTLSKTKFGFTISLNINPEEGNVVLLRETDTRIKVFKLSSKQTQMLRLLNSIKHLPLHAEPKLMEMLASLKDVITIHSDLINTSASLKTIQGDARVTVQLIPIGNTLKVELFIKPLETQPPYCKPGQGTKSVVGNKEGEQVQVVRNFKKEKENYAILSTLLQEISGDDEVEDTIVFGDPYDCLELLDALRQQTDNCIIEWPEGAKFKISRQADIKNLSLSLKSKSNWFEMEGELELDDKTLIPIKELLGKVRKSKGRFIQLNDTEFLALSDRLRKQLTELSTIANESKGKLQVQQFATIAFDKWATQGTAIKGDKHYRALKERIEQAADKTHHIPKQLNAELRDYQATGFSWMARLYDWKAGACLADDMGLGKTVQSIAMLLYKAKQGPSLVVSPASVLLNWQTEINKFAPSLNVLVFNSAENRQAMLERAEAYDVVLSTYGLLMTEEKLFAEKKWNIAILDEAHTIKNRDTKTSKAAMKLDADFRIILTGTPIQNHLGEIWNLFQFINPGLLGSLEQFTERFIQPITQYEDKEVQKRLRKIISPFILRRTKNEVLDELPSRTEIIKEIELSEAEMAFYEVLRRETETNLANGETTPIQALAEITRLRQAACNANLVNKEVKLQSSKEETFLNIIDELITNNHRALVFSQFTSHLALIKAALDKRKITYLYLDGSTSINERTRLVKTFQTGEQPLFLISLKAGGLGLNLTAADYVIHLDPWWNPAIEDQASDRAHRIGQQCPVTIYKLIAKHTIEEKIIRLHATKKDMADSLLEGSNVAHKLTREELLELLK